MVELSVQLNLTLEGENFKIFSVRAKKKTKILAHLIRGTIYDICFSYDKNQKNHYENMCVIQGKCCKYHVDPQTRQLKTVHLIICIQYCLYSL